MHHPKLVLLVLAILVAAAVARAVCGASGSRSTCSSVFTMALLAMLSAIVAFSRAGGGAVEEGFAADSGAHSESRSSPIGHSMSAFDGVRLRTKCPDNWKHPPCGLPYYHPSRLSTSLVQGHGAPDVKPPPSEPDHGPETPTVDGRPRGPRSKFMFAYNQCRPECCPSTYSCDRGCVCTTPAQRRWLERRGRNHTQDTY